MIGDFLYQLTPRDEQVTGIEIVLDTTTTTAALAVVQAIFAVPAGRVMRVTHMLAQFNSGVGQQTNTAMIGVRTPSTVNNQSVVVAAVSGATAANGNYGAGLRTMEAGLVTADADVAIHWDGELWLPPQTELFALGVFNLAVNPNVSQLLINALLLPRGTVVV